MVDHIALLKDRLSKCETKVARYRKTLETAENEMAEVKIALRVLGEISGESPNSVKSESNSSTANRQQEIADLLGVGRQQGKSPMELYDAYGLFGEDEINLETFRTTIWRMKGREYVKDGISYIIRSGDGRYWKEGIGQAEPLQFADPELPPQPEFAPFEDDSDLPF
jgi:hypothetical protein